MFYAFFYSKIRSSMEEGKAQLYMNEAKFLISFLSISEAQKSSKFYSDLRLKESCLRTEWGRRKNSWLRAPMTLMREMGSVLSISVMNCRNSCKLSSH